MLNSVHAFTQVSGKGVVTLLIVIALITNAYSQQNMVVYKDDIHKQRLLLHSVTQYLHTMSQGQIDMDSSLLISCNVYGLSRFVVYSEAYSDGKPTPGSLLLDAGKVGDAKILLTKSSGQEKIRLLLELSSYFLFRPGNIQTDLDQASAFIQQALLESRESLPWKIEALNLKAALFYQLRRADDSQKVMAEVFDLIEKSGNKKRMGQALLDATQLLPFGHPSRLSNLEKALSIFESLQANEKTIEAMSGMTVEFFIRRQMNKVTELLQKQLEIHRKTGYRHSQYNYDVLAYVAGNETNLRLAAEYSAKTFEYITSKSDSSFMPFFYGRMAEIYTQLDQFDEALAMYDKALAHKTKETRLFWYKAFLAKLLLFNYIKQPEKSLALIEEIGRDFPPASLFEEMYFTLSKGTAYEKLKNFEVAEANYNSFLAQSEKFPPQFINNEFPYALITISRYFCKAKKTQKARELIERARSIANQNYLTKAMIYETIFRIDSTEQKYTDAFSSNRLLWFYRDSANSIEQRKHAQEMITKFETEKKDKDIQLLKQQGELQDAKLSQANFSRNISFAGVALLLFIAGLLYYLYDTKQKSNNQLTHLLTEKEWLLKEIHHRVKNNLQTVLSLLESQSRHLTREAKDAFQESQNRVYAMSLIHKKLYQSADVSSVNMEDYLRDLVQHLRDSFGSTGNIRFSLQLDAIELDVSQAVPIGLIVNEAVTNSIKYAFPNREQDNEIKISFKKEKDNKVILLVADNGVGLVELKDNSQSLGLKLMRGLSDDIDGTFTIQSSPGVTINIEFAATVPFQRLTGPVVVLASQPA